MLFLCMSKPLQLHCKSTPISKSSAWSLWMWRTSSTSQFSSPVTCSWCWKWLTGWPDFAFLSFTPCDDERMVAGGDSDSIHEGALISFVAHFLCDRQMNLHSRESFRVLFQIISIRPSRPSMLRRLTRISLSLEKVDAAFSTLWLRIGLVSSIPRYGPVRDITQLGCLL